MNFLCKVGFMDKGYRCVCSNGFEGESCKGIEPYTTCLTPGVWRVLWISRDYGDDRIGAKSKKFPTASDTPSPPQENPHPPPPPKKKKNGKKFNGLTINPPLPRPPKKIPYRITRSTVDIRGHLHLLFVFI